MKTKKGELAYNLVWIFIVGCVVGWCVEVLWSYYRFGIFINHSAVAIGPFNMAYGFSACVLSFLFRKYQDDNIIKIFIIGFIGGSILEYAMSLGMELTLGFTAWDYSRKFLNINGRICLKYSIFWGLISIVWAKFIYPWLVKMISKINVKVGKAIAIFFVIFIPLDMAFTFNCVDRAKAKEKGIPPKNKYEEFLDNTFNKEYLQNMYNDSWIEGD